MKKTVSVLLGTALLASSFAGAVADTKDIEVIINDSKIEFDVNPFIENSRTLVPMRKIFESLGCTVDYYVDEEGKQNIIAYRADENISLVIGSDKMEVSGTEVLIDVPAKIVEDRTFVPIRAISEALNEKVNWDGENYKVIINSEHGDYKILTKNLSEHNDGFDISIAYPMIENKDNDSFIEELNKKTENTAQENFENYKKSLEEEIGELRENGFDGKLSYSETYKVQCNANDVYSVTKYVYEYHGGPHPNTTLISENYNLKDKKEIKLSEVLERDEKEIQTFIYDTFKEKFESEGVFDDYVKDNLSQNAKKVNFYLNDTMVVLYFNQYDVTPYAYGIPSVEFIIGEEYADFYAELMDMISKTEVGTAGSSLKAQEKLKEIAEWFEINNPTKEEFEETFALCISGIPSNMQKEYDEQFALLINAYENIIKDMTGESAENAKLSAEDIRNLGRFVGIANKEGYKFVEPFIQYFDENATYTGVINGADGENVKLNLYYDNFYDAVEISKLKVGDIIFASNGAIKIKKIENENGGITINGGLDNFGVWLTAGDGGTYYETMMDGDIAKTSLGEFSIKLSKNVVFADKSDLESEEPKVYNGFDEVMNLVKTDETINYGTLEVLIENNEITSIIKHYHP